MIDGRRGQSAEAGEEEAPAADAPPRWWKRIRLGARLHKAGVTADQITALGLLLAAVTAVLIGAGFLLAGVALIIAGGLMDALDGAVAKAAGSSSKRGAFFDSTTDRVADALIFGGVAWYFASGHDPRLALLPFAIFAAGTVISYTRAKAESLGYVGKGGLMERAERLILLGAALTFYWVMVPLLWLLLGLTVMTAVQRFFKVWAQAGAELRGEPAEAPVAASRWRAGRVESRWRAWREGARASADGTTTGTRRARTPASRWRARRHAEPLATRVRRMIEAERIGSRSTRSRAQRPKRTRWTASPGSRRRYGNGR